jgi:hypothetical protein
MSCRFPMQVGTPPFAAYVPHTGYFDFHRACKHHDGCYVPLGRPRHLRRMVPERHKGILRRTALQPSVLRRCTAVLPRRTHLPCGPLGTARHQVRRLRCSTIRITRLVQAVLVLQLAASG